jgi:hypothetical protein
MSAKAVLVLKIYYGDKAEAIMATLREKIK